MLEQSKTEYFQILLYLKIKNTLFLLNYIFLITVIIFYTASTTAAGAAKFLALRLILRIPGYPVLLLRYLRSCRSSVQVVEDAGEAAGHRRIRILILYAVQVGFVEFLFCFMQFLLF